MNMGIKTLQFSCISLSHFVSLHPNKICFYVIMLSNKVLVSFLKGGKLFDFICPEANEFLSQLKRLFASGQMAFHL